MAKRNKFKFRCLDCKAEEFLFRGAMLNATRPKCSACGSLWLEPVTDEARDRIASGQNAKLERSAIIDAKMSKKESPRG